MAKVLNELPDGLALKAPSAPPKARRPSGSSLATSNSPSEAASGARSAQAAPKATQASDQAPKALRRPSGGRGGFINSQEGHEWLMRRCEAFGFASSRYFKKNGSCPAPVKK